MSDATWRRRQNVADNSASEKRNRYPVSTSESGGTGVVDQEKSIFGWLRADKVLVWTIALLLGHAIARLVNSLMEDVIEPAFNAAFHDPANEKPATTILGAKIKLRHFIVAIIQFILIIVIAYALSGNGRREPAYYKHI